MQRLEPRLVNSGKRGRNLLEFKTRPVRVRVAVDDADEVRAIGIAEFAGYLHCDRPTRTGREPVDITNQRNHSGGLCRARSAKRYRGLSLGYRSEPSERHSGSNIGASAMTAIDLDQQLVELRSAADAYAARHQFIPDLTWPEGVRIAVNFTCDFDAMLLRRLLNEPPMQLAKGEFGGRVGIWRLIELFDVHGVSRRRSSHPGGFASSTPKRCARLSRAATRSPITCGSTGCRRSGRWKRIIWRKPSPRSSGSPGAGRSAHAVAIAPRYSGNTGLFTAPRARPTSGPTTSTTRAAAMAS